MTWTTRTETPRRRPMAGIALLAAVALVASACTDAEDASDLADETEDALEETVDDAKDTFTEGRAWVAELDALNASGVVGTATVEAGTGTVIVRVETTGFTGGNPHAQHLHLGGAGECPGAEASGDDDVLTTAEGQDAYGAVAVALTTDGAVGPDSALAVERFPVADDDGTVVYQRAIELPDEMTLDDLDDAVVVQHGWSAMGGDDAAYDGDGESSLDPSLPLEATIPVACGPLEPAG